MPYKDPEKRRRYQREWARANSVAAQQSLSMFMPEVEAILDEGEPPEPPDDPVAAFVEWAEEELRVPTGPLSSKPFRIPNWQRDFLAGAFSPGKLESGLSVARKNGKSGLIAAWLLACLDGPLVSRDWRSVVVSLTGNLAKELKDAMQATAKMSQLTNIRFLATPIPGRCLGRFGSRVDFLAADKATGHAIGVDLAVVDEAGLLPEANRALWNAVLSSTSGREGRLLAISIRGDGPMFAEISERADDPSVYWVEYAAPEDAAYDDEEAWHAANPGLESGIKSIEYMRRMSRRALDNPANGPHFAAYDLNLPQEPSRELIVTLAQWKDGVVEKAPSREGPCVVGLDLGGSSSMTAAVVYWPESGRIEASGAFPAIPDLRQRGEADGVGGLYVRMEQRGELRCYPGRVTPVDPFIDDLASSLMGECILALGCDRYRKQELFDALSRTGITWRVALRGQGANASADGSADVRAFQEELFSRSMKPERSLLFESAILNSSISRDTAGNPKLNRAATRGRIDVLQAAVIACGLGRRWKSSNVSQFTGQYVGRVA